MAMKDELQHAAKNFREQLTAGINPEIGALVLLVHREGVGLSSNIAPKVAIDVLEQVLRNLKSGAADPLIVPAGTFVGRA